MVIELLTLVVVWGLIHMTDTWGTPLRGVNGRLPGDYSAKIKNNSQPSSPSNYKIQSQESGPYDPLNTTQRWQQPGFKSFARKNLSRPGYVPMVEEF